MILILVLYVAGVLLVLAWMAWGPWPQPRRHPVVRRAAWMGAWALLRRHRRR